SGSMRLPRVGLRRVSAGLSLFFATNAIETLRTALNGAYRVVEKRPYVLCLLRSMLFVLASAVSMLVVTWVVVVGPAWASHFDPSITQLFLRSNWLGATLRYASAGAV